MCSTRFWSRSKWTRFHHMSGIEKRSYNHIVFKVYSILIYFVEYQVILEDIQFGIFICIGIKVLLPLNRHFPTTMQIFIPTAYNPISTAAVSWLVALLTFSLPTCIHSARYYYRAILMISLRCSVLLWCWYLPDKVHPLQPDIQGPVVYGSNLLALFVIVLLLPFASMPSLEQGVNHATRCLLLWG